jgi:NADH:ubiquinone oxidoreductase subunit K
MIGASELFGILLLVTYLYILIVKDLEKAGKALVVVGFLSGLSIINIWTVGLLQILFAGIALPAIFLYAVKHTQRQEKERLIEVEVTITVALAIIVVSWLGGVLFSFPSIAMAIFVIGIFAMFTHRNILKVFLGIQAMENSALLIAASRPYSALSMTTELWLMLGMLFSMGFLCYLAIRIYEEFGTVELKEIW